jgi:hypothetical protein
LETLETTIGQYSVKRAMLEVSQHLTSNYITEQYQEKQHGTGTKTDIKTSGTEERTQI